MTSNYKEQQRDKAIKLIQSNMQIFDGKARGKFYGKEREFVLRENMNNLFAPIRVDVVEYFNRNNISWWGGSRPTGHVLSSQIACVNHLFQVRNNQEAVIAILKKINADFIGVLPIESDKFSPAYIQFEAVSDCDHLNEDGPTRGNNCTSVDALIYAIHKDDSKWLIPIEWKYTEFYDNQNKATEGCRKDPLNCKGKVRQKRYNQLICCSNQLKSENLSCYYYEPFYQLMRQTLWVEQMIAHKHQETIKGDNYLHVHVIPSGNTDLLEKIYKCSGMNMERTWRNHLPDQSKYLIISPQIIMSGLTSSTEYQPLLNYLSVRYMD